MTVYFVVIDGDAGTPIQDARDAEYVANVYRRTYPHAAITVESVDEWPR